MTPPQSPSEHVAEVPIRDAATVVLLRAARSGSGLDAWVLTRVSQMAFAAGMTVFPGGRVDESDAGLPMDTARVGDVAARFGCDERQARALIGAAVRETFEETGVLLTVPTADLSSHRTDVEAGTVSFADLLVEHDLALDARALHPWSRWVTPAGETRRYDTRFFVGALPEGAEPENLTSESSAAEWVGVGEALEQVQRGERRMLPPTVATLASLAPFTTIEEVIAAAGQRVLDAVRPTIRVTDDGYVVAELPDGTSVRLPRAMFS